MAKKRILLEKLINLLGDSDEVDKPRKRRVIDSDSDTDNESQTKRKRIIVPSDSEEENNESMSSNVLQLLGEEPKHENILEIHIDVANIWNNIVTNGLDKESKDKINKKIPTLKNCDVTAPNLNSEILATLSASAKTRDERLREKQNQIGYIIANLNCVLKSLLVKNDSNKEEIEKISDSLRLLCDLQFMESETRRAVILPGLNKSIKNSLEKCKASDGLLFGKNLSETIKESKSIERSSRDLKKASEKPNAPINNPLNSWGPSTSSKRKPHQGGQYQHYHPRHSSQRAHRSAMTQAQNRPMRGKPRQWNRKKD
ncbi:unnamed protein product [Parnassius apollo]|uniref:(apollo) hypothetical protein n=1 Tax=Parnassius apollo TaxID=110799 RepID=A0A8S3WMG6_PARAO|nr:unnamed protein product [Parnassius apollo]CAG4968393.1 unnamed protein product [Parnassius apollo]CAG5054184.1 unnamed protein product [Parnassius apollo]